jgi:hypothetical protein
VLTDSLGRFAFPDVGRGTYMLRVTLPGYAERRIAVDLSRGEGRELAVLLAPYAQKHSPTEPGALHDLGKRLSFGLRRERLADADLARHGSTPICELPEVRSELPAEVTLIVNGNRVYRNLAVTSLCSWRVDEVELIELGRDVCAEVTRSVAELLGIWCSGRARSVPRGINATSASRATGRSAYVIIWEKW